MRSTRALSSLLLLGSLSPVPAAAQDCFPPCLYCSVEQEIVSHYIGSYGYCTYTQFIDICDNGYVYGYYQHCYYYDSMGNFHFSDSMMYRSYCQG